MVKVVIILDKSTHILNHSIYCRLLREICCAFHWYVIVIDFKVCFHFLFLTSHRTEDVYVITWDKEKIPFLRPGRLSVLFWVMHSFYLASTTFFFPLKLLSLNFERAVSAKHLETLMCLNHWAWSFSQKYKTLGGLDNHGFLLWNAEMNHESGLNSNPDH